MTFYADMQSPDAHHCVAENNSSIELPNFKKTPYYYQFIKILTNKSRYQTIETKAVRLANIKNQTSMTFEHMTCRKEDVSYYKQNPP